MTSKTQKKHEIFYASECSRLLNLNWKVSSSPDEDNYPDLLIVENNSTFGLEVTELFKSTARKGSLIKAQEQQRTSAIERLSKEYYKTYSEPIKVNFIGDIPSIEEFCDLIDSNVTNLSISEDIKIMLPNANSSMHLMKLPKQLEGYSIWNSIDSIVGWVEEISEELLSSMIEKKGGKLARYKSNLDDVRLLIYCNRLFDSGKFILNEQNIRSTFGFNKVYFMSYPQDACQLNPL